MPSTSRIHGEYLAYALRSAAKASPRTATTWATTKRLKQWKRNATKPSSGSAARATYARLSSAQPAEEKSGVLHAAVAAPRSAPMFSLTFF